MCPLVPLKGACAQQSWFLVAGLLLATTTPHWHIRPIPQDSTKFSPTVTTTPGSKVKHRELRVDVPLFPLVLQIIVLNIFKSWIVKRI